MSDKQSMPPLEGFYSHVPGNKRINLFEIVSGLTAVNHLLSRQIDGGEVQVNEGLSNAACVLSHLLQDCWHGGEVILKPHRRTRTPGPPRPRRAKPMQAGSNVVTLIRGRANE